MGCVAVRVRDRLALGILLASHTAFALSVGRRVSPAFVEGLPAQRRTSGRVAGGATASWVHGRALTRRRARSAGGDFGPQMLLGESEWGASPVSSRFHGSAPLDQGTLPGRQRRTSLSPKAGFQWFQTAKEDTGLLRFFSWALFGLICLLLQPFSGGADPSWNHAARPPLADPSAGGQTL
jgi:hypothetical protein